MQVVQSGRISQALKIIDDVLFILVNPNKNPSCFFSSNDLSAQDCKQTASRLENAKKILNEEYRSSVNGQDFAKIQQLFKKMNAGEDIKKYPHKDLPEEFRDVVIYYKSCYQGKEKQLRGIPGDSFWRKIPALEYRSRNQPSQQQQLHSQKQQVNYQLQEIIQSYTNYFGSELPLQSSNSFSILKSVKKSIQREADKIIAQLSYAPKQITALKEFYYLVDKYKETLNINYQRLLTELTSTSQKHPQIPAGKAIHLVNKQKQIKKLNSMKFVIKLIQSENAKTKEQVKSGYHKFVAMQAEYREQLNRICEKMYEMKNQLVKYKGLYNEKFDEVRKLNQKIDEMNKKEEVIKSISDKQSKNKELPPPPKRKPKLSVQSQPTQSVKNYQIEHFPLKNNPELSKPEYPLLHTLLNCKIHLSFQQKQFIFDEIHKNYSGNRYRQAYQVMKSQILFFHPEMMMINFHDFVDEKSDILALVKMQEMNSVIVVYSEAELSKKEVVSSQSGAFLAVVDNEDPVNNSRVFYLKKRNSKAKALVYNDYYLVFGNSQLRIKRGQNKAESNIPTNFQYFDTPSQKNPSFMFGTESKEALVQRYQLYKLHFQENRMIY